MKTMTRRSIQTALAAALLSVAYPAWAQTATVNVASQKQLIRGFGGMNQPVWIADLTAAQRDTAFGNGAGQLGFSVLRVWISDVQTDWVKDVATAQRAIALGAIVFATPWNPPANLTVTLNGQKEIDPTQYAGYAAHLNDYVSYMKGQGVSIYAVGVQNEPDFAASWTAWTPTQVHDFVLGFGAQITTKLITAESFNYTKGYYDPILNDPNALANVAIVGTHLYGTPVSNFPYPLFDQKGAGKERWMTEHYTDSTTDANVWPNALNVAIELENAMVQGQFSAYTWWYIRRFYGPIEEDGTISKRGYCMAQFSKFVRPGFHRVDATASPAAGVMVSAFASDGDVVVVIVNTSTTAQPLTVAVNGSNISSYTRFTTSASKSLANDGTVNASNGSLSLSLDPQSVTTLHGGTGVATDGGTGSSLDAGISSDAGGPRDGGGAGGSSGSGSGSGGSSGGGASRDGGGAGGGSGSGSSGGASPDAGGSGSSGSSGSTGAGESSGVGGSSGGPAAGGGGSAGTADASTVGEGDNATPNGESSATGCGCTVPGGVGNPERWVLLALAGGLALVGAARWRSKNTTR